MVPLELQPHPRIVPFLTTSHIINNNGTNTKGKRTQKDEQHPFIEIIHEEGNEEEPEPDEQQNNTTVSTVCSIRANSIS
jgi:hypothetical protein